MESGSGGEDNIGEKDGFDIVEEVGPSVVPEFVQIFWEFKNEGRE